VSDARNNQTQLISALDSQINELKERLSRISYLSSGDYSYADSLLKNAGSLLEENPYEAQRMVSEANMTITNAISKASVSGKEKNLSLNISLMGISSILMILLTQRKKLFGA
jgi:hypothetical protein